MLHRNILNTNFQNCLFSSFFSQVDGNAPTFVTKPTIRQDADGSTLIFHCSIFADPKPVVSWFHNGDKIQDNKKFQVCKWNTDVILVIDLVIYLGFLRWWFLDDLGRHLGIANGAQGLRFTKSWALGFICFGSFCCTWNKNNIYQ